ncbi:MAG: hypothetical protein LBP63_04780, partial [Prevotellaceae bacterium]|nr:hypothetical protein [Prevotellaceae bacterium]
THNKPVNRKSYTRYSICFKEKAVQEVSSGYPSAVSTASPDVDNTLPVCAQKLKCAAFGRTLNKSAFNFFLFKIFYN